jgi:hypothetical protein
MRDKNKHPAPALRRDGVIGLGRCRYMCQCQNTQLQVATGISVIYLFVQKYETLPAPSFTKQFDGDARKKCTVFAAGGPRQLNKTNYNYPGKLKLTLSRLEQTFAFAKGQPLL